jgi:hypothetical protein
MTPHPDAQAGLQRLQDLAERYLDSPRVCFVCRAWPATSPMLFVGDATGDGGRRQCAVFATCAICLSSDDFEKHVSDALKKDMGQREGALWN